MEAYNKTPLYIFLDYPFERTVFKYNVHIIKCKDIEHAQKIIGVYNTQKC